MEFGTQLIVTILGLLVGIWYLFCGEDDEPSEPEVIEFVEKDGKRWYIYTGQRYLPSHARYIMVDASLKKIPDRAFRGNQRILRVYIPGTVRKIGKEAFEGCTALGTVRLDVGLKSIGEGAFFQCLSLRNIMLPNGLESIGDGCFCYCKSLRRVSIPSSMEMISDCAFNDCHSLVEVNLHSGIKVIGPGAFGDCKSIQEIDLPEGLKSIKHRTFEACISLQSIAIPDSVEIIDTQAFESCSSLTAVKLAKKGLKVIGPQAFSGCVKLVNIELPQGLKVIGHHAFNSCVSMRTMTIPGSVDGMEESAFQNCHSLIELNFGNGLKIIALRAFAGCSRLSAVALPPSLEWIHASAFKECSSLVGIEIPFFADIALASECFGSCKSLVTLSVPSSCHEDNIYEDFLEGSDLMGNDREKDVYARWRNRFEGLPVHEWCYHSPLVLTREKLMEILKAPGALDTVWDDPYGMTPMHLVATSTTLRQDILACLVEYCPREMLWHLDDHRKTMMDYILHHTSHRAVPLMKMVLSKVVVETISSWSLGDKWRSVLLPCLMKMQNDNKIRVRCTVLDNFFAGVGGFVRIEVTSLVELAVWKMRMNVVKTEGKETDANYRRNCQFQSGAGVVIENVMEYLWHRESETSTGLSLFPLYTTIHPGSSRLPDDSL